MYNVKETVEVTSSIEEEWRINLSLTKLVEGEIQVNESADNCIKLTDNA